MLNAPVLIQSLQLSSIGMGLSLDRLGIFNAVGLFACHTLPPVSATRIVWLLVWQFSVLTITSHVMLLHHIYFLCVLYIQFLHCLAQGSPAVDDECLQWRHKWGTFNWSDCSQLCWVFARGYETTSSTLTFASYLLANNSEVQERLVNDIHDYLEETLWLLLYKKCWYIYIVQIKVEITQ